MTDLITLAQAKTWLNLTNTTTDDVFIQELVDAASQEFLTYTSRSAIQQATYTERRNGTGTTSMTLQNRPVQSITSLTISGSPIPASSDGVQPGYYNDDTGIYLVGGSRSTGAFIPPFLASTPDRFWKGYGNVFIEYVAGFPNNQINAEPQTVPSSGPYQITINNASTFAGSLVVTYQASGVQLTAVIGVPSAGQYVIAPTGVLTMAAADAGAVVLCSYQTSAVPPDIQKCVYEMVGWAYKAKDRIGMQSQRFADALSTTFAQTPFSPTSKLTIERKKQKDVPQW